MRCSPKTNLRKVEAHLSGTHFSYALDKVGNSPTIILESNLLWRFHFLQLLQNYSDFQSSKSSRPTCLYFTRWKILLDLIHLKT